MASSPDIVAWRIVKARYAASAFDGEGARRAGGRWSAVGRAAVYAADSVSLAALELLVHLQSAALLEQYLVIPCRFGPELVTIIDGTSLPLDWRASPPPAAVRDIGNAWLDRRQSAVLSVPSAVIDLQRNYVINPHHEDFNRIEIEAPRTFAFDPRLAR